MWKNRYKIYPTSDPNLLITSVCSFPNMYDTLEKSNEYYEIDKLNNDKKYLEIYSFLCLKHFGRDFVPVAFADRVPKLQKLQDLQPIGKGWFWCLGYVSPYLKDGVKAINKPARSMSLPDFDTYLDWLKHYTRNYDSSNSNSFNIGLFEDALRLYLVDNSPAELNNSRRFNLIYNNQTIRGINRDMTTEDMINHLENLKNRDYYEILVNDFR